MSSHQSDLRQQLDEARANALRLKNEHRAHLHVVATSPTKRGNTGRVLAKEAKEAKEARPQAAISASVMAGSARKSRIPAYRPPTADEDLPESEEIRASHTVDEEEEAEAVVGLSESKQASHQESHVERVSMGPMVPVDVLNTPLFLTTKKNVMHCELDEPGKDIPFPKNQMKRGFFRSLFGCFHRPSIYSPPRVTSHRPRPPSSGMVPKMLSLEKEVAPLRSSLVVEKESGGTIHEAMQHTEQTSLALAGMHHEAVTIDEGMMTIPTIGDIGDIRDIRDIGDTGCTEARRGATYSNRLLKQQEAAGTRIPLPTSAMARSRSQSPVRQRAGTTHSGRSSAQTSPIRMTKAQRLREQANLKKIEERNVAESAHFQAMPKGVRRSFLPQLQDSLNASNFDAAKRDSIVTAAAKVLATEHAVTSPVASPVASVAASERNPMDHASLMSYSFSDDPFYRELAKIDHSLTPDDLDKLRGVLAASNHLEMWK
jgi:hypothetical protein